MSIESFLNNIKKGETPFYARLNRTARRVRRFEVPYMPGLHDILYRERQVRINAWRTFWRVCYYQPLLRSRCASCGSNLRIYHSGQGLPLIMGDVDIRLGSDVSIYDRITIAALTVGGRSMLSVGDDTDISQPISILVGKEVTIGSGCLIGCTLITDNPGHRTDYRERLGMRIDEKRIGRVVIGDYVWAALQSMVIGDVTIGDGAIIAARAVVTRDVPPFCVAAGNPAKIVKKLPFPEEMIEKVGPENYKKYQDAEIE
jgi:acetyltransferase-like isoleucine patch superfamily enzyme